MVNRFSFIVFFLLISVSAANSQKTFFRADCGLGTFSMKDLKSFQTSALPDIGVNVESISKFPPYFGYGITILYHFNSRIGYGFTADYYSTGGRNYYKDYSGSYSFDLLTHAWNIGAVSSFKHIESGSFTSFFEIRQGLKISRLKLKEELVITDPVMSQSYDLGSTSYWINPLYRVEYKLNHLFSLGAFVGVEYNPSSILRLTSNHDATLRNKAGDQVRIDWTGVRFGLSVSGNLIGLNKYY
jgi:hypothetical protein